ncbi:Jerky -like protein-like [Trichinella zimbabwensis]|uniref:Jerky-like protein-like n=1 Tax=Trichinella zimbabwensis TaxID=268475 RepID=A0A0V1I0A8_9BILA|nr:Jerky -like protein-like [Trichinella zimbabwensis]
MSTNRKRNALSLEQKLEVCLPRMSDICRSRLRLSAFVLHMNTSSCCSSRKSMKKASNSALDSAVYMWFLQKPSSGWLRNFKSRHDVRELKIHSEELSADNENAAKFTGKKDYDLDFVYSADETHLVWKFLPKRSLVSMTEKTAGGFKLCKERVTVLCCANATGSDRLPLLLVGKSKRPRSMIGVQKLPVVYDHQLKAWMTGDIFCRWYDETFIPHVEEYQQKTKRSGKVLLIIDNASEWLSLSFGLSDTSASSFSSFSTASRSSGYCENEIPTARKFLALYVQTYVKSCFTCSEMDKTAKAHCAPLNSVPLPSAAWEKLAVDLVGPFHSAKVSLYYLQTNGEVERFNNVLKNCVQAAIRTCQSTFDALKTFLMAYRSTAHSVTGQSPSQLLHGRSLRTKLHVLAPANIAVEKGLRQRVESKQQYMKKYTDQRQILKRPNFKCGDYVRVRRQGLSKKRFRFSKLVQIAEQVGLATFRLADDRPYCLADPVKWQPTPPKITGRLSVCNVIKMIPGSTRCALSRITDIASSFTVFIPTSIENVILEMANLKGISCSQETWKPLDVTDSRAFIGLLILGGVYRSRDEASRRSKDNLAAVRVIWDTWVKNLPKIYNSSENVTVDERLYSFKGRCQFRQYMAKKPAKYGIKFRVACCSKSSYGWNMQSYTGKPSSGTHEKNQGMRVVLDVTKGLKGHNVTSDNFFTSYSLGLELRKKNLTLLGRALNSSRFAFSEDCTVLSYISKKNKKVLTRNVMHNDTQTVSAYNAYVLWTETHPTWNAGRLHKRRLFFEELGKALKAIRNDEMPRALPRIAAAKSTVERLRKEAEQPSTSASTDTDRSGKERARCQLCVSRDNKTSSQYDREISCASPVGQFDPEDKSMKVDLKIDPRRDFLRDGPLYNFLDCSQTL